MSTVVGKRKPNFTLVEKRLLVELATKHPIVYSPKKDLQTQRKKEVAWQDIFISFNAQDGVRKREVLDLRTCFTNLSQRARSRKGKLGTPNEVPLKILRDHWASCGYLNGDESKDEELDVGEDTEEENADEEELWTDQKLIDLPGIKRQVEECLENNQEEQEDIIQTQVKKRLSESSEDLNTIVSVSMASPNGEKATNSRRSSSFTDEVQLNESLQQQLVQSLQRKSNRIVQFEDKAHKTTENNIFNFDINNQAAKLFFPEEAVGHPEERESLYDNKTYEQIRIEQLKEEHRLRLYYMKKEHEWKREEHNWVREEHQIRKRILSLVDDS